MKKSAVVKASRKSAVTQPKFQTNEVEVKGKKVILTGELAEEVQNWIRSKDDSRPVPGHVTFASVLRGLAGSPLKKQVKAAIVLPADLLAWAEDEAWNQSGELSDLVRELLQYERYRWERLCTYAQFARKEGGAE